jgi:hypothetical protein
LGRRASESLSEEEDDDDLARAFLPSPVPLVRVADALVALRSELSLARLLS